MLPPERWESAPRDPNTYPCYGRCRGERGEKGGECWWAGKGGVGRGESGRVLDDDGGGVAAGNRRRAMGGVPRARTSIGNPGVSGRKGGRGRELIKGNSTHHDLRTVSRDNVNDGDVIPHVSVVASAVGAVPAWPSVELHDVGVGNSWDHQSSMTTTPLALPSSWGALPVIIVVFAATRP